MLRRTIRVCTLPTAHNAAHVTSTRRPQHPRAGSLQASHVVTYKHRDNGGEAPLVGLRPSNTGDVMQSSTGQLDYWQRVVAECPLDMFHSSNGFTQLTPSWDVVVPLLESLREHGRGRRGQFIESYERIRVDGQNNNNKGSSNDPRATHNARIPLGERFSAADIARQFEVELGVRLPLLERSLATTCTPLLLARLCRAAQYCNVAVPARACFERSPAGVADARFRLRAMIVAAFRQCESLRFTERALEAASSAGVSPLRRARRLAMEAPLAAALLDFTEANRAELAPPAQPQGLPVFDACPSDVFHIDFGAECPLLVEWGREGKEFLAAGDSNSARRMFALPSAPSAPLAWLPGGKSAETDPQIASGGDGAAAALS